LPLPPVATAGMAPGFEKSGRGGGGGNVDLAASAVPYVFAFHLAMGVRLVGLVLSRFGAGGGGRGGPSGWGPGNNGKGSNNGGGPD
jgi:hypothetical protein